MQVETSDVRSLAEAIIGKGWQRVGLDGVDGVGKSQLAASLGELLSWPVVGLDKYLHKKQGGFAPFINYSALTSDLQRTGGMIVEGVCLLDVLSRVGARIDGHVYMKRFQHGYWADEDECVFPNGIEEAVVRARDDAELFLQLESRQEGTPYVPSSGGLELTEELMRYHDRFHPHEVAAIVFRREVA
jgi:hypothetical protein